MGSLNDEIDSLAVAWAAKVARGDLTEDERACLESWQAEDIRHAGAFARAQAVLTRLDRLRAVGADALRASIAEMTVPTDGASTVLSETPALPLDVPSSALNAVIAETPAAVTTPQRWTRRRMVLTGSAAASFAAAGVVSADLWNRAQTEFTTKVGETRVVNLPDGSVVTLNTDSKMTVRYTEAARNIRLERGEALFKVAKNRKRPFIVAAFDTEVRAVGTSFTVRLLPKRPIQVLVQEGVVEVIRRDRPSARPVRAVAETQALVMRDAPIIVHPVPHSQVARQLVWQFGRIAFENETLADAASEFGRYSDTKIIVDPALANRTITGLFASNDPVGFAKVTASVLGLRVEVEPREVRIVR